MQFLCLALTDDLNLGGLFTTQGYLIPYDFIFDRIPERSIKDNLHLIALHKTHLYYPLTETTMTVYLYDHATLTCLQFR